MGLRLNCPEVPLHRASITQYEKNRREPPLIIILSYARLARVKVELLIDDDQSLEAKRFGKSDTVDKNKQAKINKVKNN